MKPKPMLKLLVLALTVCCWIGSPQAVAQPRNPMDPSLTQLGYIPLPDLGPGTYTRDGHTESGGLYPEGWPTRPPEFETTALEIAKNRIRPLDGQGNPDSQNGKIVLMSAGMSNTVIYFEGHAGDDYACFRERAQQDPARNRQLVVVNGAQGTRAAMDWEPADSTTYSTMKKLLDKAKVTPAQVQVVWVLHALRETGPWTRIRVQRTFSPFAPCFGKRNACIVRGAEYHKGVGTGCVSRSGRRTRAGIPCGPMGSRCQRRADESSHETPTASVS